MYKTQMKLQKFFCFFALVGAAILFVYSLGFCTDLYDVFYTTMRNPKDHTKTDVPGSIIYYDVQDFNHWLTILAIVLIVVAVALFIMSTHKRRRYYIGNYVVIIANMVIEVAVSIWAIIKIALYRNQLLTTVDYEALKTYGEFWNRPTTISTFIFDIGFVVCAILIISAVLLGINLLWKQKLMKEEANLLSGEGNCTKEVGA